MAAVRMWRLAAGVADMDAEALAELRNSFGDESNEFLRACRADLQSD